MAPCPQPLTLHPVHEGLEASGPREQWAELVLALRAHQVLCVDAPALPHSTDSSRVTPGQRLSAEKGEAEQGVGGASS